MRSTASSVKCTGGKGKEKIGAIPKAAAQPVVSDRRTPSGYKKVSCKFLLRGNCTRGDERAFEHNEGELRGNPVVNSHCDKSDDENVIAFESNVKVAASYR